MISVYLMSSEKGPKTYVGSAGDMAERKRGHKRQSVCTSRILIDEYGWDNIIFTVLEECTTERRWECEQYWIDFVPNTVNIKNAFATKEERKEREKIQQKAWYEANKGAVLERRKEHRKAHEETQKEYMKLYYQANKESLKKKREARYESNK